MNRLAFEYDQSDAAARALRVIGDMSLRHEAVDAAERREMRLKDQPVPQGRVADPIRAEKMGERDDAGRPLNRRHIDLPGICTHGAFRLGQ